MLSFTKLDSFGVRDGNEETVVDFLDVAPFQDVPAVVFVAVLGDHVGASQHGLEEDEGEGTESDQCLVLDEAKGCEVGDSEEVYEDPGGNGKHFLDLVLEFSLEATHDLAEGAKSGGRGTI